MSTITILPHPQLCPAGSSFEAKAGSSLCDNLLRQGVALEHACEKVGTCATCHVLIRQGGATLRPADDDELDQLDTAWGVETDSRLACRVKLGTGDLVVELPRYTRNHARER